MARQAACYYPPVVPMTSPANLKPSTARLGHRLACLQALSALFTVALAATLAPGTAQAQPGSDGSNGSTTPQTVLTGEDLLLEIWQLRDDLEENADLNNDGNWVRLTDFERERFFNAARCRCKTPVRVTVGLTNSGGAKRTQIRRGDLHLLIGNDTCVNQSETRNLAACPRLSDDIQLVGLAQAARIAVNTTADFFFQNDPNGCDGARRSENIRVFLDESENDIPDLSGSSAPNLPITIDSRPPPAPSDIAISSGDQALTVDWSSIEGLDDFLGYVVFCSRAADLQVFKPSPFDDQYLSQESLCGSGVNSAALTVGRRDTVELESALQEIPKRERATPETPPDPHGEVAVSAKAQTLTRGPFASPEHFLNLDPRYVCSNLLTNQTSTRIARLQNGIRYLVGVSAVDKFFNASPVEVVYMQSPVEARDFWEGYRDAGGQAEGGFCSLSPDSPAQLSSLVCVVFALALTRLRNRRTAKH